MRSGQAASSTRSRMKEGEEKFLHEATIARRHGAAVVVMAFDEVGQADTFERKIEICKRAYDLLVEKLGFPAAKTSSSIRTSSPSRPALEEHNNYGVDFIEATRWIRAEPAARAYFRRRLEPVVLVPRQRAGARGDALGVPVSRHQGRHGHGHRQCRADGDL